MEIEHNLNNEVLCGKYLLNGSAVIVDNKNHDPINPFSKKTVILISEELYNEAKESIRDNNPEIAIDRLKAMGDMLYKKRQS